MRSRSTWLPVWLLVWHSRAASPAPVVIQRGKRCALTSPSSSFGCASTRGEHSLAGDALQLVVRHVEIDVHVGDVVVLV